MTVSELPLASIGGKRVNFDALQCGTTADAEADLAAKRRAGGRLCWSKIGDSAVCQRSVVNQAIFVVNSGRFNDVHPRTAGKPPQQ